MRTGCLKLRSVCLGVEGKGVEFPSPLELSCWDEAAEGTELSVHLPWALLALVSLLCHQTLAVCCCHCHPTWGLCQPHTGAPGCLCALLGAFAGNVPHPWERPFVPGLPDRALGSSASELDCPGQWEGAGQGGQSDPSWHSVLCVQVGVCWHCREQVSPSQISPTDPKGS